MMAAPVQNLVDTGIEVIDLKDNTEFASRKLHTRDTATQMEGLRLLSQAFISDPFNVLQVLVDAAVDLCGADSAGITIEREKSQRTEASYFQWIATAGRYSRFNNATLPHNPNPCCLCIDRHGPQLFHVTPRYFELMGIVAEPVTDGLLIPWEVDETRGTVWVVAHENSEAFDSEDLRMMQILSDFAAMAIRQQRQQLKLMQHAGASAAADMANSLANQINNPLQAIANLVYLASGSSPSADARSLINSLAPHLELLTNLVTLILSLPETEPVH